MFLKWVVNTTRPSWAKPLIVEIRLYTLTPTVFPGGGQGSNFEAKNGDFRWYILYFSKIGDDPIGDSKGDGQKLTIKLPLFLKIFKNPP